MTPMEAWTGKRPYAKHLKVFGSLAVALDKGPRKGSKFQPNGMEYIMVGYSVAAKGYRLYDPSTGQLVEKRDELFDEHHDVASKDDTLTIELEELEEGRQQQGLGDEEIVSDSSSNANSSDDSTDQYESAEEKGEYIEEEARRGPGRPKIIRTGKPGRPKKQYNILGALASENVPIPLTC
ncbi:hypothetical protein KR074_001242, partial [Drosophila pseudoananassae]